MSAVAERALDFHYTEMISSRKGALNSLIASLDAVLGNSELVGEKELFSSFFSDVVNALEMPDEELATLFKVSRPTIGRWKRGEAAPHALGRTPVFESLRRIARKKAGMTSG